MKEDNLDRAITCFEVTMKSGFLLASLIAGILLAPREYLPESLSNLLYGKEKQSLYCPNISYSENGVDEEVFNRAISLIAEYDPSLLDDICKYRAHFRPSYLFRSEVNSAYIPFILRPFGEIYLTGDVTRDYVVLATIFLHEFKHFQNGYNLCDEDIAYREHFRFMHWLKQEKYIDNDEFERMRTITWEQVLENYPTTAICREYDDLSGPIMNDLETNH